jgi:tetratricopeptide (TPR) repeat protein/SAM-dependent methyltransferase
MTLSTAEMLQEAMARHGRGELERAAELYSDVLGRDPGNADALHLTGVIAHQQSRNEDAVALIGSAIAKNPRAAAYRNNLGLALMALGRSADAEDAFREALAIAPDFTDALLNLGNLRGAGGRFAEAAELLERAIALGADSAETHCRVGGAYLAIDRVPEAVAAFGRALVRDGDHLGAQLGLVECLGTLPMSVDPALLEVVVLPLLRARSVNPRVLGHATARLLARRHGPDAGDDLLEDEVARLYLARTVNVSAPLERLLTEQRARWLAGGDAVAPSRWEGVGAVALQCFLNEFVWMETPEETRLVTALEERIAAAGPPPGAPDEERISDLLMLACYRPLSRTGWVDALAAIPLDGWPEAVRDVMRVCLHEPLREQALKASVVSGAAIEDDVSRAVQAQYEENPYPRWTAIGRGGSRTIEERVRRWCPDYAAPPALSGSPRVLVAGCGTGMDAIELAMHVPGAEVTAIDLSRASLAFAMRKSEEYGLENIRFRHEDILAFEGDGEPYHMINCAGVLHHMQDVAAGLARLVPLLLPGGVMKIALYSRIARAPLMAAREDIRGSGFGPGIEDIRRFRRQVLDEGEQGPHGELMGSTDFYSTSECRDLLFHVQELQLTLPELRTLLDDAGLAFLGFELTIPEVEQGFRREQPQAALDDLDAWHDYEQRHPESFRGMYYFWCTTQSR